MIAKETAATVAENPIGKWQPRRDELLEDNDAYKSKSTEGNQKLGFWSMS